MRTVILNGSPHGEGHTAALLNQVKCRLTGEVQQFDAFSLALAPCRDCRACQSTFGCTLPPDQMEPVLTALQNCDRLILASPIWLETLTPPLLALLSRLQPFFYHKDKRPQGIQKAGLLLTGGGSGGAQGAYHTAKVAFWQLNVEEHFPLIASTCTDTCPARLDDKALAKAAELAAWLNE